MKRSVEFTVLAGFGLAVVILLVMGAVSFRATLSVQAAAADRAHINQVRFAIQSLLSRHATHAGAHSVSGIQTQP